MKYIKRNTFLKTFAVFLLLVGTILYLRFDTVYKTMEQKYQFELHSHNKSKKALIERHLINAKHDLLYLADIYHALKTSVQHFDQEYLRDLELTITPFLLQSEVYSQVRYLNLAGKEILRLDYRNNKVHITDEDSLQDKSLRYYVKDSAILQKGEIYISRFDLNKEKGKIEKPYKSVIRLSTPIIDENNNICGYAVLNCTGESVVDELKKSDKQIHTILLNKDAYYLESENEADKWGFDLKNGITYQKNHPKQWNQVQSTKSGDFLEQDSYYAFLHLDPVDIVSPHRKAASKRNWTILSYVEKDVIYEKFFEYLYSMWWIFFAIIIIITFFSYLLARYIKAYHDANQRMDIAHEAFKHSSEGLIVLDRKVRIIQVNKAFEKLTGYSEKELLSKNPNILKDHDHTYSKTFFQDMWKSINEDGFWNGEVHNLKKSGEKYIQHLSIGVVRRDGDIKNYIGVCSDVTEHKQMESDLINAKETSEKANQAKDNFLANMSHEIRTPMNVILGFSELLSKTELNYQQKNYIDKTYSAANSLLYILNDILDLSKIAAGKLTISKAPFKPARLIQQCVDLLQLQASRKDLELTFEIDKNVPEYLIGDNERIRQILINLIGNAIKYTEKGSVHVDLSVIERTSDTCVIECVVTDTGIGILLNNQMGLFDHFTQVDNSATRKTGGTGLGLAICKQLVDAMDGYIDLESEHGSGSSFSFELKLEIPTSVPEITRILSEQTLQFKNLQILLVEDSEDNREVASAMLKNMGIHVDEASTGKIALDMVRKKHYDLVLMDIRMPDMDGLSATKILRDEGFNDLLIIAVSAHASEVDQQRSLDAGMNMHMSKPLHIKTLRDTLLHWFPDNVLKNNQINNLENDCWVNELPEIPGLILSYEMCDYWLRKENFLDKLEQFMRAIKEESAHVHKMIDKKETTSLLQRLHKLKGSVKLYGAKRLFESIVQLENALNSEGFSTLSDYLHEFDAALSEITTP